MASEDVLVINLKLDWRVVVVLGVIVALLALATSAAGADEDSQVSVNSPEIQQASVQASGPAPAREDPPVVSCDGDRVATVNGECVSPAGVGAAKAASADETVGITAAGGGRHVYLTNTNYYASDALTVCANGYHMASFWEIMDISNLTYAYSHPDAYTRADSGSGPPSNWYGRVHTGYSASGLDSAGAGNCLGWTSDESTDEGTFVRLSGSWETAPGEIVPWHATTFGCHLVGPVWCVGD